MTGFINPSVTVFVTVRFSLCIKPAKKIIGNRRNIVVIRSNMNFESLLNWSSSIVFRFNGKCSSISREFIIGSIMYKTDQLKQILSIRPREGIFILSVNLENLSRRISNNKLSGKFPVFLTNLNSSDNDIKTATSSTLVNILVSQYIDQSRFSRNDVECQSI